MAIAQCECGATVSIMGGNTYDPGSFITDGPHVCKPKAVLHYARTWSASRRHLQRPDDPDKTLCGGTVMLSDQYTNEEGEIVNVALEDLFLEVNAPKPDCARCAKSRRKYED